MAEVMHALQRQAVAWELVVTVYIFMQIRMLQFWLASSS